MLYDYLNENFDEHDGSIDDFITDISNGTNNPEQVHYNLRQFHSDHLTAARTMNDMSFWNVGFFQGITMDNLQTQILRGQSFLRLQSELDQYQQSYLDSLIQQNLDASFVDNEQWAITSSGSNNFSFSLSKLPQYRYSDAMVVTLSGINPSGTLSSKYFDDIKTDFNRPGNAYYIEMILRQFPDFRNPITLNAPNSYIDFSSDSSGNYDPILTDSIPFSASLTNITGTNNRDVFFRINRDSLISCIPSGVTNIRFRLVASGTGRMNFVAQAMRVYEVSNYSYPSTDVDTKKGFLMGGLTVSGTHLNPDSGTLYFNPSRPKNVTHITKINSGNAPTTSSGVNELNLLYRDYINTDNSHSLAKVRISSHSNQTIVRITETISGTEEIKYASTSGTNALSTSTNYWLKTELYENKIRASIFRSDGVFFKTKTFDSNWIALRDTPRRGYLGFQYKPYNHNFSIEYMRVQDAQFGIMETKGFPSYSPVTATRLQTITSPKYDLIQNQEFDDTGDGVASQIAEGDVNVARSGLVWYGGYITKSAIDIGNPEQVIITGEVFPTTTYSGSLRVALINDLGLVGFLSPSIDVATNKWNAITIPVQTYDIASEPYFLLFFDSGFLRSQFEIRNIKLWHPTIGWFATPDQANYQPFYEVLNSEWSALTFKTKGTNIGIRGVAYSDRDISWIESFSVVPFYNNIPKHYGGNVPKPT